MPRSRSESSRLLSETGRCMCLATTAAALACVSLPGALPGTPLYLAVAACLVLIGLASLRTPRSRSGAEPFAIVVAALAAILLIGLVGGLADPATSSALVLLAGGSIASVTISVGITRRNVVLLAVCFLVTFATLSVAIAVSSGPAPRALALTLIGWMFCVVLAVWLGRMAPQTVRRITSMSRAYSAERAASEMEARRRQDARLLHDTVLATLTLLAHSGVGVSERALREQAAEDAALLRQLRMGLAPEPVASGDYNLKPVYESTLGNTLESVKQRFRRIGLEVNWHGTGHVLLPSETLDAFLLALAECLENVRRHSGVDEAHVTITDDEATVRAMVTDAGVGFDLDAIAPGRLGFAESIVARLRDVGGNARLFSSPGSGTTVVLEVPK
ncbi:MAG: histidine kinase [Microbacteriaceae bacterium]|nr:MAG: histidine kinase [Microbacteriaceae bacterium]